MENVPEILALWSRLTGFDPEAKSFSFGSYDVRTMSEGIRRAQELDPTDGLSLMLLEAFFDAFLESRSFNASKVLANLEAHFRFLTDAQELRRLLLESGMPEVREEMKGWVVQALAHYGAAHRADIKALLASRDRVAFLWRDALEAVDKGLKVHYFMRGEPEDVVPRYHDHVLSAFTVNGLLQAMVGMPSGIVLAMIRDAEAMHSFFVFGLRNGANLTVITDRTAWAHPFAKKLSRRPDRGLDRRMGQSWFPYSVLDVSTVLDEAGEVVGTYVPRVEALVPNEVVARRMTPIRDLEPEEVVWTAMMFSLLTKSHFHATPEVTALSYLGEQVKVASGMEVAAFNAHLPVKDYEPLVVEPLRTSDLTRERVVAEADLEGYGKSDGPGENRWMEDRYAHRVPDHLLNRIAAPGTAPLLIGKGGTEVLEKRNAWPGDEKVPTWTFETFDASSFDTKSRLLADRIFVGRHNQAMEVDRLARLEFEERKAEIQDWWRDALVANKAALLAAAGKGEMIGRPGIKKPDFLMGDRDTTEEGMRGNILRIRHIDSFDKRYEHPLMHNGVVLTDDIKARSEWTRRTNAALRWPSKTCAVNGSKPSWRFRFTPRDSGDLALLAGVTVGGLPDVLRHWTDRERHQGNHILSRIDPMDWVAKNPWRDLEYGVDVWLSQSGFKTVAKANGGLPIERHLPRTEARA